MIGRVTTPVLYHIEVSHYNEKARWALDYKGVPHKRKAPMPMAHMAWALALTRGRGKTFPILRLNGDTIDDSTKIIERLERDYPQPPLYPDDPDDRRRALELEEFFDEELAPHIRRAAFAVVTRDPEAFAWIAAPRAGKLMHAGFKGTARWPGRWSACATASTTTSAERGPREDRRGVRPPRGGDRPERLPRRRQLHGR